MERKMIMMNTGERVAHVEARIDAQAQEFVEMRASLTRLEDKMDRRFESVDASLRNLSTEMHAQFRWLIVGMANAALTIIVAMFAKELLMR
jgi:hypothetical protein